MASILCICRAEARRMTLRCSKPFRINRFFFFLPGSYNQCRTPLLFGLKRGTNQETTGMTFFQMRFPKRWWCQKCPKWPRSVFCQSKSLSSLVLDQLPLAARRRAGGVIPRAPRAKKKPRRRRPTEQRVLNGSAISSEWIGEQRTFSRWYDGDIWIEILIYLKPKASEKPEVWGTCAMAKLQQPLLLNLPQEGGEESQWMKCLGIQL